VRKSCIFPVAIVLAFAVTSQTPLFCKERKKEVSVEVAFTEEEKVFVGSLLAAIGGDSGLLVLEEDLEVTSIYFDSAKKEAAKAGAIIERNYPEVDVAALADFVRANSVKMRLSADTSLSVSFKWYSELKAEIGDAKGGAFWLAVREKEPNFKAIVTLSRVGFNADHNRAIIYVGLVKGMMNGNGNYLILEKVGDEWQVVKVVECWIS
jgi:hypothetical protein